MSLPPMRPLSRREKTRLPPLREIRPASLRLLQIQRIATNHRRPNFRLCRFQTTKHNRSCQLSQGNVPQFSIAAKIKSQLDAENTFSAGKVDALAVSSNGLQIATAVTRDASIHIWDAQTGRHLKSLAGLTTQIHKIAFSPNGDVLGMDTRSIRVWKGDGTSESVTPSVYSPDDFSLSADGSRIASTTSSFVRLYDRDSKTHLIDFETTRRARDYEFIALSPQGNILAAWNSKRLCFGGPQGEVEPLVKSLFGGVDSVKAFTWSSDGKLLAWADSQDRLFIVDRTNGQLVNTLRLSYSGPDRLAFVADNKSIAAINGPHLDLWDVKSGKLVHRVEAPGANSRDFPQRLAVSADGSTLALAFDERPATTWTLATGAVGELPALTASPRRAAATTDPVATLTPSAAGRVIVPASGRMFSTAYAAKPAFGYYRPLVPEKSFRSQAPSIVTMAFSPDGQRLATASRNQSGIEIWNCRSGQRINLLSGHTAPVTKVVWSATADNVTLVSLDDQGKVIVWATDGKGNPLPTSERINDISISGDGSKIAAAANILYLYDWRSGEKPDEIQSDELGAITHVAFSPDSKVLAVSDGKCLAFAGRPADVTELANECYAPKLALRLNDLVWSPSGEYLANSNQTSATNERMHVYLRTTSTNKSFDFPTEVGSQGKIAFAAGGKAIAEQQRTLVRIWSIETGQLMQIIRADNVDSDCVITSMVASPAGNTLAVGSDDGQVTLWSIGEANVSPSPASGVADQPTPPSSNASLNRTDSSAVSRWRLRGVALHKPAYPVTMSDSRTIPILQGNSVDLIDARKRTTPSDGGRNAGRIGIRSFSRRKTLRHRHLSQIDDLGC